MSRGNVGTPRIYINMLEYLCRVGLDEHLLGEYIDPTSRIKGRMYPVIKSLCYSDASNSINLSKANPSMFYNSDGDDFYQRSITFNFAIPGSIVLGDQSYIAFLNHNFATEPIYYSVTDEEWNNHWDLPPDGVIINSEITSLYEEGLYIQSEYNGFGITKFTSSDLKSGKVKVLFGNGESYTNKQYLDNDIILGGIAMGSYFDFPHTTMIGDKISRSYNYSSKVSQDGRVLSNAITLGKQKWSGSQCFDLSDPLSELTNRHDKYRSTTGKREYSLSFSYLSDSILMSKNEMFSGYFEYYSNYNDYTLDEDYAIDQDLEHWHFKTNTIEGHNDFTKVLNFTFNAPIYPSFSPLFTGITNKTILLVFKFG